MGTIRKNEIFKGNSAIPRQSTIRNMHFILQRASSWEPEKIIWDFLWNNLLMLLAVRISSYGCTWDNNVTSEDRCTSSLLLCLDLDLMRHNVLHHYLKITIWSSSTRTAIVSISGQQRFPYVRHVHPDGSYNPMINNHCQHVFWRSTLQNIS